MKLGIDFFQTTALESIVPILTLIFVEPRGGELDMKVALNLLWKSLTVSWITGCFVSWRRYEVALN